MSDKEKFKEEGPISEPVKPVTVTERSGTATRNAAYKQVYRATGDHRAAIRTYCSGNKWLTENAKAVGNW